MNYTTLFIATHNKTNLKYLAKTIRHHTETELMENYHGSGVYWKRHLKKHGDDVSIEIIGTFETINVRKYAVAISYMYDIVESKSWANLKIEDGLSGGHTYKYKTREEMKEIKERISLGVLKSGRHIPDVSGKNNPMYGYKWSEDQRQIQREKALGRSPSEETIQKMKSAKTDEYWISLHGNVEILDTNGNKICDSLGRIGPAIERLRLPKIFMKTFRRMKKERLNEYTIRYHPLQRKRQVNNGNIRYEGYILRFHPKLF